MAGLMFLLLVFIPLIVSADPTQCDGDLKQLIRAYNVSAPLVFALEQQWLGVVNQYILVFPKQSQPWDIWFQGYKDHQLQMQVIYEMTSLLQTEIGILLEVAKSILNDADKVCTKQGNQFFIGDVDPDYLGRFRQTFLAIHSALQVTEVAHARNFFATYPFLQMQLQYNQTVGMGYAPVKQCVLDVAAMAPQ